MIIGLYSSATALDVGLLNHAIIARNLAHVDMPGYRRQFIAQESFQRLVDASSDPSADLGLGTQVRDVYTDFGPGPLEFTGNQLDLAITGDGFFVLDGPDGPLYTRNGVFRLNGTNGQLVNSGGLPVRGPITLPPGTTEITIANDGSVLADGAPIGQLEVVRFANPELLQLAGTTLFQAPLGITPEPDEGEVHQGYRERSNVQVIDELVMMIAGLRYYEAAQRALRSLDEALQQNTQAAS